MKAKIIGLLALGILYSTASHAQKAPSVSQVLVTNPVLPVEVRNADPIPVAALPSSIEATRMVYVHQGVSLRRLGSGGNEVATLASPMTVASLTGTFSNDSTGVSCYLFVRYYAAGLAEGWLYAGQLAPKQVVSLSSLIPNVRLPAGAAIVTNVVQTGVDTQVQPCDGYVVIAGRLD